MIFLALRMNSPEDIGPSSYWGGRDLVRSMDLGNIQNSLFLIEGLGLLISFLQVSASASIRK